MLAGRARRARGDSRTRARPSTPKTHRLQLKLGNRDLSAPTSGGSTRTEIASASSPRDAVYVERREWGRSSARPSRLTRRRAGGRDRRRRGAGRRCRALVAQAARDRARDPRDRDATRSARSTTDRAGARSSCAGSSSSARSRRRRRARARGASERAGRAAGASTPRLEQRLAERRREAVAHARRRSRPPTARRRSCRSLDVVRAYRAERAVGSAASARVYASRLWEFLSDDPRESNTEGGIFPAIFGTVMMVLIMSVLVGAARRAGRALPARVRAGRGRSCAPCASRSTTWPACRRSCSASSASASSSTSSAAAIDRLFFAEALPTPTFGTGGILWASLTLALLTVPVVIVATEEALAAVPRVDARGLAGAGRDQVPDDPARRAARGRARHPHRPDPGDGARRRRGGAADDHRRGQARARRCRSTASSRSSTSSASSCTWASTSTTSASRARTSRRPSRWSSPRRSSCSLIVVAAEPDRDRRAQPPAPEVPDVGVLRRP